MAIRELFKEVLHYGESGLTPYSPNNIRLLVIYPDRFEVYLHRDVRRDGIGYKGYMVPIIGDNVKEWVTERRLNGRRYKPFYRYLSDPVCGSLEGIILVHGRDDIHLDEFGVLDGLAYGLGGDVLDGVRSRFGRLRGILEIRYSGLLVPESIYQSVADLSGDENVLGLLHTRYRGSFLYRGGENWKRFWGSRPGNYAYDRVLDTYFRSVLSGEEVRSRIADMRMSIGFNIIMGKIKKVLVGVGESSHYLVEGLRKIEGTRYVGGAEQCEIQLKADLRRLMYGYHSSLDNISLYRIMGKTLGKSGYFRKIYGMKGKEQLLSCVDSLVYIDAMIHERNYDESMKCLKG